MGQGWCLIHHLKSRRGKSGGNLKRITLIFAKCRFCLNSLQPVWHLAFPHFFWRGGSVRSLNYERLISFLYFKGCYIPAAPYNALPLTRQMWITSQTTGSVEEKKSWNNGLTLKEESVIYATSQRWAKAALHCSLTIYQTICVGTQSDMDS